MAPNAVFLMKTLEKMDFLLKTGMGCYETRDVTGIFFDRASRRHGPGRDRGGDCRAPVPALFTNTNLKTAAREVMAIFRRCEADGGCEKSGSIALTFNVGGNSYALSRTDTAADIWTKSLASFGSGISIDSTTFSGAAVNFQKRGTVSSGKSDPAKRTRSTGTRSPSTSREEHMSSRLCNKRGITLIESVIAILLVSIGLVGLLSMQPSAWRASARADYLGQAAMMLSQELTTRELGIMNPCNAVTTGTGQPDRLSPAARERRSRAISASPSRRPRRTSARMSGGSRSG